MHIITSSTIASRKGRMGGVFWMDMSTNTPPQAGITASSSASAPHMPRLNTRSPSNTSPFIFSALARKISTPSAISSRPTIRHTTIVSVE